MSPYVCWVISALTGVVARVVPFLSYLAFFLTLRTPFSTDGVMVARLPDCVLRTYCHMTPTKFDMPDMLILDRVRFVFRARSGCFGVLLGCQFLYITSDGGPHPTQSVFRGMCALTVLSLAPASVQQHDLTGRRYHTSTHRLTKVFLSLRCSVMTELEISTLLMGAGMSMSSAVP